MLSAAHTPKATDIVRSIPRSSYYDRNYRQAPALIRALVQGGVDIDEARWIGADLESVFMTETGAVQHPERIVAEASHAG